MSSNAESETQHTWKVPRQLGLAGPTTIASSSQSRLSTTSPPHPPPTLLDHSHTLPHTNTGPQTHKTHPPPPLFLIPIMRIITGDEGGLLKSIDLEAQRIVVTGRQQRARAIRALCWARNGTTFAAARQDGVVSLWEDGARVCCMWVAGGWGQRG